MQVPRSGPSLLAGVVIGVLLAYAIVVTALLVSRGDNPLRTTTVVIATVEPSPRPEASSEESSTPVFVPGKHPALLDLQCPAEDDREPDRHAEGEADGGEEEDLASVEDVLEEHEGEGLEEVTLAGEWLLALCAFDARVAINANSRVDIGGGESALIRLQDEPLHHLPGLVDSNSPTFWLNEALYTFNSRAWPSFSRGADALSLNEPVYVEFFDQLGSGGRWLESIWRDPATDYLYGWYHREPEDLPCLTAPVIGAAISYDFGASWIDQGTVMEDPYAVDCDYENGYFGGGNGDFSVILDTAGEYFYFLYSNYGGPIQEQGIGIARSAFADAGQPGTVWKWDGLDWAQPGIGGYTYPIIPADTSWAGPEVDAFWGPSVHWNPYLERYVMLLNRSGGLEWEQEGVYISFSTDLLTWTIPHKLFDTNAWYPQVIGSEPGESDTLAGRYARLYLSGISLYSIEFTK